MRFKKTFLCSILLLAVCGTLPAQEQMPSEGIKYPKGFMEWGAGMAGSLAGISTPLTFYPIAYYLPLEEGAPYFLADDNPLTSISPLWPSYIVSPLGSSLCVYYCGKAVGDRGSLLGSILGAGLGEVAWWFGYHQTRGLFPENVLAAQTAYFARPVIMGTLAFAGYKLIPPIGKKERSSMGLNVVPLLDERGAGLAFNLRF